MKKVANNLVSSKNKLFSIERSSVLLNPKVKVAALVGAMGADFLTLYVLADNAFTESIKMVMIMSFTVVFVLDTAPDLLASIIHNKDLNIKQKKIFGGITIGVFLIFYLYVAGLALASQDTLFAPTYTSITGESVAYEITLNQRIAALGLGVEPLGTSVIVFVISMLCNPDRLKRQQMEIDLIKLKEESNNYSVMIEELEKDMEFDLNQHDLNQKNK